MIFSRTIDSQLVAMECDASLEPAAADVLRTLADLARAGTQLRDGLRVRFGWSVLTLRAQEDGLRIYEPLFAGDPLSELNPTLDITLSVLARQVHWLHRVREGGEDVVFDQQIVLTPDALGAVEIFALRGELESTADSGWSVAPVPAKGEDIEMSSASVLPIYRLVDRRPGLLSILTLPKGYLVRLREDEVVEITDPNGNVRWKSA
jgi:hypothetical protein